MKVDNEETMDGDQLHFDGFVSPQYTQVPDELFDRLMAHLTGAELKVLLYIVRRTYGFKKQADSISLSQMVKGIRTKEGAVLDSGTGLGKTSVARALNRLEAKNIITRTRSSSKARGDEPTTYALKMRETVSQNGTPPNVSKEHTLSRERNTQQTDEQDTEKQASIKKGMAELGIDKKTIDGIIQAHGSNDIAEKLSYVNFLRQQKPPKVRNPRGWLLKAIANDYGPPTGYEPLREKQLREAKSEANRKRGRDTFARARESKEAHLLSKRSINDQRLDRLRAEHKTSAEDSRLWKAIQSDLRADLGSTASALVERTWLLGTRDQSAVIATENAFSANWFEHRMAAAVQSLLRQRGHPVEALEIVVLDDLSG